MIRIAVFMSLLTWLLPAPPAWGQNLTGTIVGTVSDSTGAALPGAEVRLIHVGTNHLRVARTGPDGGYSAPNLPVGDYRLEVSLDGFRTEVLTAVTLRIDQRARFDLTLEIGSMEETIEVVASRSLLQTDTSAVGAVIDRARLGALPLNGRQFEDLVQLVPGAVTPAEGSEIGTRGGFNVSGFDENWNSFFLDGFDNVDPVIRNFSFRPSIDLIEEFRVIENAYPAEYGRNAGAVVNVTTRSGTNDFHGSIWEYLRNDNLDARSVFTLPGTQKPDLIRNQFGASLGGVVVPDRTFFFVAFEGLREKRGETHRATVPTLEMRAGDFSAWPQPIYDPQNGQPFPNNMIPQARIHALTAEVLAAYPEPNASGPANRIETANHIENGNDVSIRLDHDLFDHTHVMGRYSFSDTTVLDPFRSDTTGGSNLGGFGQTNDRIRTNAGISVTTVIGSRVLHEFRAGYNRFKQPQLPLRELPPLQAPLAGFVEAFLSFEPAGYESIGSGREFFRVVNVYNYIDQWSWVTGGHVLKFGADVRRYLFNAHSARPNIFQFNGSRGTGHSVADMLLGLPSLTVSFEGDPHGNPRKTEIAAYAQDDWKVAPSLTLNYGLRWEWYGRILENVDKQSTWDPGCNCILVAGQGASRQLVEDDWNNFAPRLGFAWRPFRSANAVIRGGGGIFYDSEMRHNFLQIANVPFLTTRVFPDFVEPTMDDPFPTGSGFPSVVPFALPERYRDSYAGHWNLGFQREWMPGLMLEVSYVGNHMVKARRMRNLNQPLPGQPRPYAGFGPILMQEQAGSSVYHSLQVRTEARLDRLSFVSSYTWGHAIDDRPGQAAASIAGFTGMQNNNDPGAERADADFDVRHRYTLSFLYDFPSTGLDGALGVFLDDWSFDGILTLQSGRPFTILAADSDNSGTGENADRPDRVVGIDPRPADQGPDNWIDPAAFSTPSPGTFGNVGRNTMRGPSLAVLDVAVVRSLGLGEGQRLQFRGEFFNFANHPNFGLPAREFGGANFGVISSTVTTERQLQLSLRYEF